MCTKANLKVDTVGSFLRPNRLKEARQKFELKEISVDELREIENQEIQKIVDKQIEAGLEVVTDGEFRQSYWHLDFFWGFSGVEHNLMERGYLFHGEETRNDSARLTGKINFSEDHPYFQAFLFLKKITTNRALVRQSIPAPAQFYAELVRESNEEKVNEFYPNREDLFADISKAYRETILKFYELGCRDIKIDDCTWGMLCDQNFWKNMAGENYDQTELQEIYLKLNNEALKDLPKDLRLSTHVCRGNYHSTWATSGGYAPVAEYLFGKENVDNFYLEFDDDRSGDFEPLKHIPANKNVVLGLITSKNPTLEEKSIIINRIKEASKYIPLNQLSLSPQCGFASTEEGNILTEEDQWNKIRLIKEIAEEVWN